MKYILRYRIDLVVQLGNRFLILTPKPSHLRKYIVAGFIFILAFQNNTVLIKLIYYDHII